MATKAVTRQLLPSHAVVQSASIAFLAVKADALGTDAQGAAVEWARLCTHLSPRVEQVGAASGLLDLGPTPLTQAGRSVRHLLATLTTQGVPARAGMGPTSTLAQLALLMAPHDACLALVTAPQAPALLHRVPARLLAQVHPCQAVLGPEVITRLEKYGLSTLGHVARLETWVLCQQFGDQVGQALAVLSHGKDLRPVQPTPLAHWHRVRLRWEPALGPLHTEQAVRALPRLVERAVALLEGHAAGALRVGVGWASGTRQLRQTVLRAQSADARLLCQEAERLLRSVVAPRLDAVVTDRGEDGEGIAYAAGIEEVGLWLGACAAQQPAQTTFWRTGQQRHEAVHAVAERLVCRHERPLVLQLLHRAPAAIFAEESYTLLPTGTDGTSDTAAERSASCPRSGAVRALANQAVVSAWDDVPQRLHWW